MILEKSLPIFVQRYPPPPSSLLSSDPALPTYDSGEEFATLCAAIPATLLPFDQVPCQIQRLLPGHQLAT